MRKDTRGQDVADTRDGKVKLGAGYVGALAPGVNRSETDAIQKDLLLSPNVTTLFVRFFCSPQSGSAGDEGDWGQGDGTLPTCSIVLRLLTSVCCFWPGSSYVLQAKQGVLRRELSSFWRLDGR